MKYLALIIPLLFTSSVNQEDEILGKFLSPEKDGKISFFQESGKYYGKLFWSEEPERLDYENPDESLRGRKVVGLNIFYDFSFDEDDNEWHGMVYDPQSGNTYKCNMWLIDEGKTLKVRGYIGFSWIGRTEEFERID